MPKPTKQKAPQDRLGFLAISVLFFIFLPFFFLVPSGTNELEKIFDKMRLAGHFRKWVPGRPWGVADQLLSATVTHASATSHCTELLLNLSRSLLYQILLKDGSTLGPNVQTKGSEHWCPDSVLLLCNQKLILTSGVSALFWILIFYLFAKEVKLWEVMAVLLKDPGLCPWNEL